MSMTTERFAELQETAKMLSGFPPVGVFGQFLELAEECRRVRECEGLKNVHEAYSKHADELGKVYLNHATACEQRDAAREELAALKEKFLSGVPSSFPGTLKDWFAGQALTAGAKVHSSGLLATDEQIAKQCYDYADAMLAEKRRREGAE